MIIYNLNIIFIILLIIFSPKINITFNKFIFNLFFVYTLLFVGLRESGSDLNIYIDYYNKIKVYENFKLTAGGDILFEYIVYIISNIKIDFLENYITQLDSIKQVDTIEGLQGGIDREVNFSFYILTLLSAFFSIYPIFKFCSKFKDRWTSLLIVFPYFIIIVSMSAIRQSIAIGFLFFAIISLLDKKKLVFVLYILIGSLFHKTLIIMLLLLFLAENKIKLKYILICMVSLFLIYLYRSDEINRNFYYYIGSGQAGYMQSKGVWLRLPINLIAVIIYFKLENKFNLSQNQKNIYFAYAIMICFFALICIMSTLASDRLLMYSAPFQILVFYKFIYAFNDLKKIKVFNQIIVYSLILGAFFVWFRFSGNSFEWLPYKNLLLRI